MKLSEIAVRIGCRMESAEDVEILRIAGIEEAGPGDLSFISNRKYIRRLKNTRAAAVILAENIPPVAIPSLRTEDPYIAFAHALEIFHIPLRQEPGIHPTAFVDVDVEIGANASIGAHAAIGKGCRLGSGVTLFPNVVLYPGVRIGNDVLIHSCVTVREHCRLGNRVILQNGVVIGSDGLGFAPTEDGGFYKIVQTGTVTIEDDVEIGANTTIDRAAVGETVIRRGAKLDNLVQIGHGCRVGEDCVLAAQAGLAGSTRLGRGVWVGGQAGFAGHLNVGDGAVVTAQSGTSHDVPAKAVVSGSPAFDNRSWLRSVTVFPKLADLFKRIRVLEKDVDFLKKNQTGRTRKES
ncbi:MAG: UDP-3-O-(3-hydroxymyristoyl)glucosamine N-acyltransferase [Acidobacteria bacterium]|nr:UDP-3-O-(3-hydroxymyristoyl)glucosamine N-acyltransferase [Acidobacteriota bacterium]